MKKLNILFALVAILIRFNSYSQTIQDVEDRIQQISAAISNEEIDFLEVELSDPNFPFTSAQASKLDSEIIQIATYANVRFGENHTAYLDYTFNYQAGELVYVSISKIDEIDGKQSPDIANKKLYFHKGKVFAAIMGKGDVDSYTETELEASDFLEQVESLKLFEKSGFLLEKSKEAFIKNK